jgi:peptide/nickel transport system permease protein
MKSADWSLKIGAGICGVLLALAIIGCFWTPYDAGALAISHKLLPPSALHWFGTDQLGRDVLSMIMAGARNSLGVAMLAVVIGAGAGVPLGLLAAARGGFTGEFILRGNDLVFAFPAVLLAILITAVFGPGAVNAIIAIGIFNVPVFTRFTRGAALSAWQRDFVPAARLAGKSTLQISVEHILPNLAGLLIVQASMQFSLGILAEAGLSYLGLGSQPPHPSWGRMLHEAQTLTAIAPHLAVFPGLAIMLSVLGFNLLGDGLRDRLDVRTGASSR